MHGKRVCKNFEIKNLGEYHDLYLESGTLLLVDVFKNFIKMCLKIYQLDLRKKFIGSWVSMASSFKKD